MLCSPERRCFSRPGSLAGRRHCTVLTASAKPTAATVDLRWHAAAASLIYDVDIRYSVVLHAHPGGSAGQGSPRADRTRQAQQDNRGPLSSARPSRPISPPEEEAARPTRLACGDRKARTALPTRERSAPNGEGAVRYKHPDRLSAWDSSGTRRVGPLSTEGDQPCHLDGGPGRRKSGNRARHKGIPQRIRVGSHRPRDCRASSGAAQGASRQAARRNRVGIRAGACDVACDARCQGISRRGSQPSECLTPSESCGL